MALLTSIKIFFCVSDYWFQGKKLINHKDTGSRVAAMYAPETGTKKLEPSATTVRTSSVKITPQCQNYIAANTEEM
jgi:hypothetical protein